jgi:putative tricarboxylic transport membrane protein
MSESRHDIAPSARKAWPFDCCGRRGGLAVAGVLGMIGAFFATASLSLPFGDFDLPGPGFLPFGLGLVLVALSVAILVITLQEPGEAPRVEIGHAPVLVAFAGLMATAALFERLGAFLSLGGFAALMLILVARVRIVPAVLSSAMGMLAVWYVFKVLLGVQLPVGPLEGIL